MFFTHSRKSVESPGRSACGKPNRWRYQPRLEALECRLAPAIIMVTTSADDNTPNDGSVSLREAIQAINNGSAGGDMDIINQNPGTFGVADFIQFNISLSETVQTINVGSTGLGPLPALVKPMTITGLSEVGASLNTLANADNAKILIELNGANAGPNADGLLIGVTGAGSTIEGLCINRFSLNGIELQGGGSTITGNFVGTNPQGNAAQPNQNDGIHIKSSSNIIGGTTPGDRNIVSGNAVDGIHIVGSTGSPANGNHVIGNFVGVNASGTGAVGFRPSGDAGRVEGNGLFGIEVSGGSNNKIGGATASQGNVIGLNLDGIELDNGAQANVLQGNYVGVGADGLTAVGNLQHGIALRSDDNLAPPLGPGQANEPAVSGNIIGLDPTTNFSGRFNLIEFNDGTGIAVFGNPLPNNATPFQNSGNSILGNSIFDNGILNGGTFIGIDLTNGFVYPGNDGVTPNDSKGHGAANDPNNFQNFPVLTSAALSGGTITITGTIDQAASPNTTYRIEFFASQPLAHAVPEGRALLGALNVTTNASGHASFKVTFATTAGVSTITATATNLTPDPSAQAGAVNVFNTSEFSPGIASNTPIIVAATDAGDPAPDVKVRDLLGNQLANFLAFNQGFTGGVRVAVGDVNGDGIPDIIVAAGAGMAPEVKVIDGTKLNMLQADGVIAPGALLADFDAYSPSFQGGVYVAFGLTAGVPEIVTGAGAGGGPHVKVIDGTELKQLQATGEIADSALLGQFYAYSPFFSGGVRVAAADLNGDGVADIVTGAGPGGGPHVKAIDGTKLNDLQTDSQPASSALLGQFYAYSPDFSGGVFVAASSQGTHPVIVTGAGAGNIGPQVKVLDATLLDMLDSNSNPTGSALLGHFFAYDPTSTAGVTVAATDLNADGVADVITGGFANSSAYPLVKAIDGTKLNDLQPNQEISDTALLNSFLFPLFPIPADVFVGGQ
jgi:CSLREA domain-containing protein